MVPIPWIRFWPFEPSNFYFKKDIAYIFFTTGLEIGVSSNKPTFCNSPNWHLLCRWCNILLRNVIGYFLWRKLDPSVHHSKKIRETTSIVCTTFRLYSTLNWRSNFVTWGVGFVSKIFHPSILTRKVNLRPFLIKLLS